ncbi:hypothetical protein DYB37_002983 [Aphanomyces astaci]|nr:hypothetical protein DYB36_004955 [Aphanomyces astaci]RHY15474.1 hypothetical protein DYB25_001712 [Aphanomyces astaci]RHY42154.1 hypothetical protein DYB38_006673 [Aphanomyces astaci]RHY54907.1 hypothetical protein DYB34_005530 [Aphanomyces astaci]RHY65706.1 hypothetical protein DYB30_004470 [Aphanomyces astaci]
MISRSIGGGGRSSRGDDDVLAVVAKVGPDSDTDWSGEFNRPLASADHYQHYMPPNMPMCPTYQVNYVTECNRSWKLICKAATPKMKHYNKDGIVLFYDEFFHRLFQRDPGFEDIFPGIRKRIEVLIKAMKFILNDSGMTETVVIQRCRNLGHRHRTIPKVKPHHFSAYASTFVEVAMFWLDIEATPDVGEAWSNLVGFNLKYMLQSYLFNTVNESDWNQNTTQPTKESRTTAPIKKTKIKPPTTTTAVTSITKSGTKKDLAAD